MASSLVSLRCGDLRASLGHGDVVGRLADAALFIDDPRVSELHAYVSHREAGPVLLALRGALQVDGIAVREVVLEEGMEIELCPGVCVTVASIDGDASAHPVPSPPTQGRATSSPLRLVTRFDSVCIAPLVGEPLVLAGLSARLITELVACGSAAHWAVLAQELWSDERDPAVLRPRWDKVLASLRRKLREAGLREDLVTSVSGQVQLVLHPHDSVDAEG